MASQLGELQSKLASDSKDKKDLKVANEKVDAKDVQTFLNHVALGR